MASQYLAMYIEVQFISGKVDNPIVPVRHFSSSRPRLGEATKSGEFFTDMDAALREWKLATSGALEISVLFDSTLPGRENIVKGRAKTGMAEINENIARQEHAFSQIPAIQRPDVSGFRLFFGMKTVKTPYPREVDISKWRNFFTKPGAYIELWAPSFERNAIDFNGNNFVAMTFRDWNMMAVGGP